MEPKKKILLLLPLDFNYALDKWMVDIRLKDRRTKADEIIRLAQIGLNIENSKL